MTKSQGQALDRIRGLLERDCKMFDYTVYQFDTKELVTEHLLISATFGPKNRNQYDYESRHFCLFVGKRGGTFFYRKQKKVRFEFYSTMQAVRVLRDE